MTRFILAGTVLAGSVLAFAGPVLAHPVPASTAQQANPQPEIKATDLGDGLFMLQGRGGNLGVLTGPDGVFVIDSQFADIAPANLAKINEIAGSSAPRFLINTHWHGDHVGGNAAFSGAGATVIAQENVFARVSRPQSMSIAGQAREVAASDPSAWPTITFEEGLTLRLNGQTIRATHLPAAHTDGDTIIVFEEANIIHIGDIGFTGNFPFIDISSGGSVDGFLAALDVIDAMSTEDTRIIPGHGPLSTRQDIRDSAAMLRATTAAVEALVREGRTLEEVLAARPLEAWNAEWGNGFMTEERFTTILFMDRSKLVSVADE